MRESPRWNNFYAKGRTRWLALRDSLQSLSIPHLADMNGWNKRRLLSPKFTERYGMQCAPGGILTALDNAHLYEAKLCSNQYWHFVQTTREGLPPDEHEYFRYANWYSARSRAIIAADNVGRIDEYTARLRWSEVVHLYWAITCWAEDKDMSELEFIPRLQVTNPFTWEVMDAIVPAGAIEAAAAQNQPLEMDWSPADPDFYALLGTPQGKGPVSLLTQYAASFATRDPAPPYTVRRVKTIRSIKAVITDRRTKDANHKDRILLDLAFTLEDVDPPPGFVEKQQWDPSWVMPWRSQ